MKTFFSSYKPLFWIVIILLVLNISAITSITFYMYRQHKTGARPPFTGLFHRPGQGVFLKEQLGLSDQQYKKFSDDRTEFRQTARNIDLRLMDEKKEFLKELMDKNPDAAKIRASCDSIGILHAQLMQESAKYYNEIRELCNSDQVSRLNSFFIRVIQNDDNPGITGRRIQFEHWNMNRFRHFNTH